MQKAKSRPEPHTPLPIDAASHHGQSSVPRTLNPPGHWNFFISHGQAMAGDQAKTLCLLLREAGKTVWYDNDMADRSTRAMEEGVRGSDNFLLFLSGEPEIVRASACTYMLCLLTSEWPRSGFWHRYSARTASRNATFCERDRCFHELYAAVGITTAECIALPRSF